MATLAPSNPGPHGRRRIAVHGSVQGVGFRPFVYHLAKALQLGGQVANSPAGVVIEVEGGDDALAAFLVRLRSEAPPLSRIEDIESVPVRPLGDVRFSIHASSATGAASTNVLPDIATCAECLAEMRDPADRRYRYPFINCTHCGPRYSILRRLPYDRPNTSMAGFALCADCQREYDDPDDRRFHAQPVACPKCGPQVSLLDAAGTVLHQRDDALQATADALRGGAIVALKGLGGFHLVCDAQNIEAVRRLRARKARQAKPLALLYPSVARAEEDCIVSDVERAMLESPEAPIVLLRPRGALPPWALEVARDVPAWGVLLPYTPLHHLLMDALARPLVATSGNVSEEPLCTANDEALSRLAKIADQFLVHDRPIVRPVDDGIVRVVAGQVMVLRRARGFAPTPLRAVGQQPAVLAVGAHLKNTVAVSRADQIVPSQHLGDLETAASFQSFTRAIEDLQDLFDVSPEAVVCDLHPDYLSTQHAASLGLPVLPVQHHFAHVLSCMAEHALEGPVLGVCWDGTGYGPDGTIWGGEFLHATRDEYTRVARLRPFRLPGGEQAVREPRRAALGLLHALGDTATSKVNIEAFSGSDRAALLRLLDKDLHSPWCSSMGRLFDAVASLLGLCAVNAFEGQAAMALERAALDHDGQCPGYAFALRTTTATAELDWAPVIIALITDATAGLSVNAIAAGFHRALADAIVLVARHAALQDVVLTGGCFQNAVLSEWTMDALLRAGFVPHVHRFVPPNDGGVSVGQAFYGARRWAREGHWTA